MKFDIVTQWVTAHVVRHAPFCRACPGIEENGCYKTYAYGKTGQKWLYTDLILSQVSGRNKHRSYRKKVQEYSNEEGRFSENLKLGIVIGTKEFADSIKKKYLPDEQDEEIPQQKFTREDIDLETLMTTAAVLLECKLEAIRNSKRIKSSEKINRDLLAYMAWKTGAFTNKEIGRQLGLTYSAVSHCVRSVEEGIPKDRTLERKYLKINSLFKM